MLKMRLLDKIFKSYQYYINNCIMLIKSTVKNYNKKQIELKKRWINLTQIIRKQL